MKKSSKRWRKRQRTEGVDSWVCPYCGTLNDNGFDSNQADNMVTIRRYTGACVECYGLVKFWISYLFIAQPLEGDELKKYLAE